MNAETYFLPLCMAFVNNSDSENAVLMSNYLKGQFPFYGLTAPLRRELQKQFYKEHGFPPAVLLNECVFYAGKLISANGNIPEWNWQFTSTANQVKKCCNWLSL